MRYKVCTYGHPVLRAKAKPIIVPDMTVPGLADDMLAVMEGKRGVGLAAPQIGLGRRICVINFDPKLDVATPDGPRLNPAVSLPLVLINPEIMGKTGRQTDMEGCLSVPEIWAPVTRAKEIIVKYDDFTGMRHEMEVRGFLARVIQHELDHLEGVLFVDRMSPVRKVSLAGELKRMRRKMEEQLARGEDVPRPIGPGG